MYLKQRFMINTINGTFNAIRYTDTDDGRTVRRKLKNRLIMAMEAVQAAMMTALKPYHKVEGEIAKRHCETNEDGSVKTRTVTDTVTGAKREERAWKTKDSEQAYMDELEPLLEEYIDVPIQTIPMSEMPDPVEHDVHISMRFMIREYAKMIDKEQQEIIEAMAEEAEDESEGEEEEDAPEPPDEAEEIR